MAADEEAEVRYVDREVHHQALPNIWDCPHTTPPPSPHCGVQDVWLYRLRDPSCQASTALRGGTRRSRWPTSSWLATGRGRSSSLTLSKPRSLGSKTLSRCCLDKCSVYTNPSVWRLPMAQSYSNYASCSPAPCMLWLTSATRCCRSSAKCTLLSGRWRCSPRTWTTTYWTCSTSSWLWGCNKCMCHQDGRRVLCWRQLEDDMLLVGGLAPEVGELPGRCLFLPRTVTWPGRELLLVRN